MSGMTPRAAPARLPLVPVDGHIALPTRPGFGIELDESKISRTERARL